MAQPEWLKRREYTPEQLAAAERILESVRAGVKVTDAVRRNPLPGGAGHVGKHLLVALYRQKVESGQWPEDGELLARLRRKPVRTLSGVTTVTVLTKPYPCPAHCIFCPTDVRMPKSYLPDEPGAARAFQNAFDPFRQVESRITSYEAVGHPTDKIELLILGGTWSAYRRDYQEEFVRRCFDAMNGRPADTLDEAHAWNEDSEHRNVGLVVETRPDEINPTELAWLRRLGVTKVQMGVQSLDDAILALNQRGHTTAQAAAAVELLRAAGFKIVLHWMPNLLGATPQSDRADFLRLWEAAKGGLGLCPDEIKIYPTQLLEGTELYRFWERGEYRPYDTETLTRLLADVKPEIPRYCRVNRVIRDIPSTHVVEGNKRTSLRQDVLAELERRGQRCQCIRCREVGAIAVNPEHLELEELRYAAGAAEEVFLSFVTPSDRLAGYLRLSLPHSMRLPADLFADLQGAAIIREVHVYGQSLGVGQAQRGAAQHIGLGTQLLDRAAELARQAGFRRLAVIAAVGTRAYYRARGFDTGDLYMLREL
ncbi:elongator complex protein 3 [Levilinea saccharolytica]|uniref:elongator complex protein 3 n=1 Tax=Levilinea saccharolytica TaxID=229921 RepID=UPI000785032E|nr:elongator complex protein 3 [Levilinea saccharolytica]GAP16817.1 histone acetyltransferase [Levilinea saccharolytica]